MRIMDINNSFKYCVDVLFSDANIKVSTFILYCL